MNLAAVIVARKGSKRIPDKRNQKIGDETLVERKIRQLLDVVFEPSDIFLGSDDVELKKIADKFGVTFIQRAEKFCDETSGTPNDMVTDMLNRQCFDKYTHILWAHPTNPFVEAKHYNAAIEDFKKARKFDSIYSATKLKGHFVNEFNQPINFSFDSNTHKVANDISPVYLANGAIFIRDIDSMVADGSFFGAKPKMFVMDEITGWDIDLPWQLETARILNENHIPSC